MGLTLNIIAHELEAAGRVERALEQNPSFEGARWYLPGKPLDNRMLYVCESAEDAQAVSSADAYAVYACEQNGGAPLTARAALSVFGVAALPVLDELLDAFSRYAAWEQALDNMFHEGKTLQDLLDISEPLLKNNVVVLDPALKLLAYTRSVPCDDPVTMELIDHGYHTEENIRKFKLHRRFKPWSESKGFVINDTRTICKYTTVVKSFKARTSFSLISVMMCNHEEPSAYLLDTYQMFLARVERYAQRDYPDDKPSGSMVDTFLKDLFDGAIDEGAIAERSQFVGIPATGRFCLFYLKAERDSVSSSRLLADVSLAVAPAKTTLVDDAVVVFCFNCRNDLCAHHCVADQCPHERLTVSQRLNGMLQRYDMTCGRSSMFENLAQAPVAFAQAREAYAISKSGSGLCETDHARNMWERIFSFDAYAFEHLANEVPDRCFALLSQTYAGRIIEELAKQDAETRMNNYDFLRAYLVYERRVTVVAEQLHMHRNNVGYRINRIEEQFGIDTDDPVLRQDLLAAYRLREAYSARSSDQLRG